MPSVDADDCGTGAQEIVNPAEGAVAPGQKKRRHEVADLSSTRSCLTGRKPCDKLVVGFRKRQAELPHGRTEILEPLLERAIARAEFAKNVFEGVGRCHAQVGLPTECPGSSI